MRLHCKAKDMIVFCVIRRKTPFKEKENTGLIQSFCKQVRELAYVSKSLLSLYWAYSEELPAVKVFSLAGVDEFVKKMII